MIEIDAGGLITKDPDAERVFGVNWDQRGLADGVEIDTSDWEINGPDGDLTLDNEAIYGSNRKAKARFIGGTLNAVYTVTNRIVTNETPAQTKDCSFDVLIQPE